MPETKKEWLKRTEIFSSLGDRELDLIAGYSEFCSVASGQFIFSEGDRGGVLYIIVSGDVQILKNGTGVGSHSGSTVIAELLEGDILGELEFFTASQFNASAKTVADTTLLRIPGEGASFAEALDNHPEVAAVMLYEFLRIFSGRLRKANVMVRDNSALVQELKRQVYGDKLTGLYNKTYLEETLPSLLKKRSEPVGLLLMKPDNFKMINDTFGHEAGDDTLVLMAGALNRFMADRGTVLRYMGNELGVMLPGYDRNAVLEEARAIMKMFNELDISSATKSRDVFLSMSIGAAVFPEHADVADDLILKAHELPLAGRGLGGNVILFPEDVSK